MARLDKINEKLDRFADSMERFSGAANKTMELLLKGGVAFLGAKAFNNPSGAIAGLVGLELAKSPGLVSNAAGVATLAMIGVGNMEPIDSGMDQDRMVEFNGQLVPVPLLVSERFPIGF